MGLLVMTSLSLAACAGGDDDAVSQDTEVTSASEDFDESQLPPDFPRNLIPPTYDTGGFVELGPTRTATFENRTPVEQTIDYYVGVLGEPTINVQGDASDRMAQWQISPWALSILGSDGESIVGFTKINE